MLEFWWVTLKGFILGALGALISLRFFDGLSVYQRWLTVAGGSLLAGFGNELVLDMLAVERRHDGIVAIVIGLFGMSVVAQLMTTLKQIDWKEVRSWLPGRKG